jgi:hypothetical protein
MRDILTKYGMEFWLYVGLIEINVKTMEEHYRIFYVYYRNIITVRYNSVFFYFLLSR